MVSKVVLVAVVALTVAQLALADPVLCPSPSSAAKLVYKKNVHVDAPSFGRTEEVLKVPTDGKAVTCILLTKDASKSGDVSIASIGLTQENGAEIKLVSDIEQAIDTIVEVYTE